MTDEATITIAFGDAARQAGELVDSEVGGKQPPAEVGYVHLADDEAAQCRKCTSWCGNDQADSAACQKVAGEVNALGTCELFEADDDGAPKGFDDGTREDPSNKQEGHEEDE